MMDIVAIVQFIFFVAIVLVIFSAVIALYGVFRYWRVKMSAKNTLRAFFLGPFSVGMLDVDSQRIPLLVSSFRVALWMLLVALLLAVIGGIVVYWVGS